jgi:ketosteroid isomerase-like protein
MGRRGKDEVRKTWQTVHARYSSMRHEIREMVAEADKVAVNIRAFFKKRSDDRTVQFDIAVFFMLRDGRIREIRERHVRPGAAGARAGPLDRQGRGRRLIRELDAAFVIGPHAPAARRPAHVPAR